MPETVAARSSVFIILFRGAGALIAVAVFCIWGWRATRWQDHLVLTDTFEKDAAIRSFMQRADGILVPGEGLAVAGGQIAVRVYALTRAPQQRMILRIDAKRKPDGHIGAWLQYGDTRVPLDNTQFDGKPIDVTDIMPPGNAMLEIWLQSTEPADASPQVMLHSFKLERNGRAPKSQWLTLLFYGSAGLIFWLFLLAHGLPESVKVLIEDFALSTSREGLIAAVLLLASLMAAAWLLRLPEWVVKKDYDDRAAIGNAAALLDDGFNQSNVYFRSRVRPGFPGIVQPLVAFVPHRLSGYWSNASDNYRQDWLIYDQEGQAYGLFTYPALSVASQILAVLMLLGMYTIFRRLETPAALAGAATVLAAVFYGRSLTIAITQTVNLCVNVLVVLHFLCAPKNSAAGHLFLTGLLLGIAFLVKETVATTLIALGLFILLDGPPNETMQRIVRSLPMWFGATIWPIFYFGGVAEGGFGELFSNFGNHLAQEQLNQFEALTFATGLQDMTVVFSWLGLAGTAVGLAAGAATRFRSRSDRFMLCWMVGCLPVFTLPYIFPRFLMYFIPSFAYWTVHVLDFRRRWTSPGENA